MSATAASTSRSSLAVIGRLLAPLKPSIRREQILNAHVSSDPAPGLVLAYDPARERYESAREYCD
jgi:hypothetical protein